MSDYIFLFDLDSTLTKKEILPEVSKRIHKDIEMRHLTEATMRGELPFKTSFLKRVEILSQVKVSEVRNIVSDIPLNTSFIDFILKNNERCYIVTGNLDIWISGLMKRIGMKHHVYCSKADQQDDMITKVVSVLDKELTVKQFVQPLVVIGDGDNDSGMASLAEIAVGFGGVREIAPSLLRNIDYAFYDESKCAEFLWSLL